MYPFINLFHTCPNSKIEMGDVQNSFQLPSFKVKVIEDGQRSHVQKTSLTEKLSHCEYLANMQRIIGELLYSQ